MDRISCYGGKKNSRNETPLSAIYEVNQVRDIRKNFTHTHTRAHRDQLKSPLVWVSKAEAGLKHGSLSHQFPCQALRWWFGFNMQQFYFGHMVSHPLGSSWPLLWPSTIWENLLWLVSKSVVHILIIYNSMMNFLFQAILFESYLLCKSICSWTVRKKWHRIQFSSCLILLCPVCEGRTREIKYRILYCI